MQISCKSLFFKRDSFPNIVSYYSKVKKFLITTDFLPFYPVRCFKVMYHHRFWETDSIVLLLCRLAGVVESQRTKQGYLTYLHTNAFIVETIGQYNSVSTTLQTRWLVDFDVAGRFVCNPQNPHTLMFSSSRAAWLQRCDRGCSCGFGEKEEIDRHRQEVVRLSHFLIWIWRLTTALTG